MTMPEFTAQASLYETSRSYRTAGVPAPRRTPASYGSNNARDVRAALVPQMIGGGPGPSCDPWCVCVTGEDCPCCPHPDLETLLARRRQAR
jgi:hypothetical protein